MRPRLLPLLWAGPTSLVGLALAVLSGGRLHRRGYALEFHGGLLEWIPRVTPIQARAMAIGHVIVAVDARTLEAYRDHELVHVRQAERWGPFFLPAYFGASALAWARGGHFYEDNWFEADARRQATHVVRMKASSEPQA